MKKIYYFAAILSMLIVSCKKDNNKKPDNSLYPVVFNVTGFSQGTVVFANKSVPYQSPKLNSLVTNSLPGLTDLMYVVYDASGNYIKSITQTSAQSDFGIFDDSLPAGNYTISFIGFKSLPAHFKGLINTTFAASYVDYLTINTEDTFIKTLSITVGSTTTTQNVTLNRVVAQLEVNIEDAIPSNVVSLGVTIRPGAARYKIADGAPDLVNGTTNSIVGAYISPANIGQTNFNFTLFTFNTTEPFTAVISCGDKDGNTIALRTVSGVVCQVNKKTILTGKLFGGSTGHSTGGFTATLVSEWTPEDTVTFAKPKNIKLR